MVSFSTFSSFWMFLVLEIDTGYGAVFNSKNSPCTMCLCPQEDSPLCAITDEKQEKFTTFSGQCEFACAATCNETTVKFVYCGKCDHRKLKNKGERPDISELHCLKLGETVPDNGTNETEKVGGTSTTHPENVGGDTTANTENVGDDTTTNTESVAGDATTNKESIGGDTTTNTENVDRDSTTNTKEVDPGVTTEKNESTDPKEEVRNLSSTTEATSNDETTTKRRPRYTNMVNKKFHKPIQLPDQVSGYYAYPVGHQYSENMV